jgi:uncharacterized coiled-coil protein SlyX
MSGKHRFIGSAALLSAVLAAGACQVHRVKSPGLEDQLDEMAVVAQRDSLLQEVTANSKLLGDIQAELIKIQPKPASGTPESPALEITKDQRSYVLDQIKQVTGRLKDLQTRLASSERRVSRLNHTVDSLGRQSEADRATIANLTSTVESQRSTIDAITGQLEFLTGENLTLADSVLHLTDQHQTAFYVVGTRQELLAKGVLVEDGHRSIPLIGKRSVAPARDLPLQEFTSIDRSAVRQIPLPRTDRKYRIVSRQDVAYLDPAAGARAEVKGTLAIASPEKFWEASRYLIVVEQ